MLHDPGCSGELRFGATAPGGHPKRAEEEEGPAEEIQAAPPKRTRATCKPKARDEIGRGKLGFLARATRNRYSVITDQPGKRSSTDLPGNGTLKRPRKGRKAHSNDGA